MGQDVGGRKSRNIPSNVSGTRHLHKIRLRQNQIGVTDLINNTYYNTDEMR